MLSLLLLSSCLHFTTSLSQTETTIDAQTPESTQTGISVSLNPQSVAIANTNYYVNVQTQDAYDIKLSLNKKWSFDTHYNATFTLTINGNTPFPKSDGDFLIVFAVGNLQYFSFFVHLDTNNIRSRIYPSITLSKNNKNVTEWIYDQPAIPQRWHRISNNDKWIGLNQWRKQSLWPLQFIITNNPPQQRCSFQFFHDTQITNTLAVSYTFKSAFLGNKNMDIYIMGDSKNEQFIISSFHILLQNTAATIQPTISPSKLPSISPTKSPTISPVDIVLNTKSDNILNKQNEIKNTDDNTHILIFTILISSAAFVVLIQICCMIKKRINIKQKYFKGAHVHQIAPTHSHIGFDIEHDNECESKMEPEIIGAKKGGNRKDTASTTAERFEYNLDGRRTQTMDELKRPNSETATTTQGYIYGNKFNKLDFLYEGIKGLNDDSSVAETISVGVVTNCETGYSHEIQSEYGLMDAKTIAQYWKNHADVQFASREDHV